VHNHKLGFVAERSHTVVPILECSALSEELNAFIPRANEVLATPAMAAVREVHAISGPPVLAAFDRERIGEGPARLTINDWVFDLHPQAFFQSNRYLLSGFLETVLAQSQGAKRVLDLFCGSGFFTIPLARNADQVLGVETGRIAVKQARLNARLNQVTNAEFSEGSVEDSLRASPDLRPDLIVLDPPRTGAGREVASLAAALRAPRIIYVSCNPSTFGREAAVFLSRGYSLEAMTLVDQFPHTFHIELIATFGKTGE
jgi:23S rRNA (uracil1939-C5)-methyltransferase